MPTSAFFSDPGVGNLFSAMALIPSASTGRDQRLCPLAVFLDQVGGDALTG
jgi:hypothetical protein